MPHMATRLAVPRRVLADTSFEVDVLSLSGVPLLSACTVSAGSKGRSIRLLQHITNKVLATLTSTLQLLGPQGEKVGTMCAGKIDCCQYQLKDESGRCVLVLCQEAEGKRTRILATTRIGHLREIGVAEARDAGQLPARHFELALCPGVDAVPPLVCFLGAHVFAASLQQPSYLQSALSRSSWPAPT